MVVLGLRGLLDTQEETLSRYRSLGFRREVRVGEINWGIMGIERAFSAYFGPGTMLTVVTR